MNKTHHSRFLAILLMLLVCLPCSTLMASASGVEDDSPIYLLGFMDDENAYVTAAFYVKDSLGDGSTYLVTSDVTTSFATSGYEIYVLGKYYQAKATYVASSGNFAFYSAPNLEDVKPLEIGTTFTETVTIAYTAVENNEITGITTETLDLTEWTNPGSFYYAPNVELPSLHYIGAPVFDENCNKVIGCIALTSDSEIAITPIQGLEFPTEAAIVVGATQMTEATASETETAETTVSGTEAAETTYSETEAANAPAPTETDYQESSEPSSAEADSQSGTNENKSSGATIIICIAAIAAVAYFVQKKKSNKSDDFGQTASVSPEPCPEGTVSLEPMNFPMNPEPVSVNASVFTQDAWQIRGVGGEMEGQVFLLHSTLKFGRSPQCDIVFPKNAPGISGLHCELAIEDGRVVLRDMQSTYGTYLTKGVQMEPRVNYYLHLGDEFTLAEGGQTFRLERTGDCVQVLTPAVRSVPGNVIYRANLDGKLVFGRDPRCQVSFEATDTSVSSRHCVLYRENDQLYLMDTGSTNGTFLDEHQSLKPNVPYPMKKGMSFFLVSPKYTFVITED